MRIIKRLWSLTLVLMLAGALLLPARAASGAGDRDGFYRRRAGECVMDGGSYYLNGTSGYVTVCRSPQNPQPADYLLNERAAEVYCVWTDRQGVRWGQLRYNSAGPGLAACDGQGERCGWVRMTELVRRYDRGQFLAEHLGEFASDYAELDTAEHESVGLWRFPGCGGRAEPVTWYMRPEGGSVLCFPMTWTDSAGRRWGSIRFEKAEGFICLDEPGLTDNRLPEIAAGALLIPAADAGTLPRAQAAAGGPPSWVWAALTAALAAAAAAALELRDKKERKGSI